jgi:phosphatidylserine/phosphatidylglycerophosphate/cardiolipin synthase-like enzyme
MRAKKMKISRASAGAAILATLIILTPVLTTAKIEVYFNSQERLEKHLKQAFSQAVARAKKGEQGTIDIMIFSFTSKPLADSMLRIARDFPNVRIRILANLSQLFREPYSVLPDMENIITGDMEAYQRVAERRKSFITDEEQRKRAIENEFKYLVSEFRQKPLPNVEIKYKWFPSFSWINEDGKATSFENEGECGYDHFHQKASLLHHKTAVVNDEILVNGSYNWSQSAETKNFENLMYITGPEKQDLKLVTDFHDEFKAMWYNPQIAKTSDECRKLKDELCKDIVRDRENWLKSHSKQ